jgi:hypothetical protein
MELAQKGQPGHQLLSTVLVVRQSTGPVRKI